MQAMADHQIIAVNSDRMVLMDSTVAAGQDPILVEANRVDGNWVVTAPGVADVTVPPDIQPGPTYRQNAITAMISQALAALPGDGYSAVVPRGLAEIP